MNEVVIKTKDGITITGPVMALADKFIEEIVKGMAHHVIPKIITSASIAAVSIPALNEGEHYAGIILGKDGAADHHLILLPGEAIDIKWQAAKDWAAEQGGELPTRREQSLLFANLKEQFKPRWHWSCEEHPDNAHYAFFQSFGGGSQYDGSDKANEFCARAVRRVSVI